MKFYQSVPVHTFIRLLVFKDHDILCEIESWTMQKEEIQTILTNYYETLGIHIVEPDAFATMLRTDVLLQLRQNPVFLHKKNLAHTR